MPVPPKGAGGASRRLRMVAAVRERMRSRSVVAADAARPAPSEPPPAPVAPRPARPAPPDPELERLEAEARYHRERAELHRARVISASPRATTPARLRELERVATAAEERLAHARSSARSGE